MATLIDIDPARQLIAAEHDLVADFPTVAPAEIHSMVQSENRRYDSAHVRDYISILVERTVRASLLTHSSSRRVLRRNGAH
jgi:methyltransferase-like protein